VFNCQSCPDTYGACGYPTCSSYTCGNAYSNGVYCAYNGYNNGATNYYCSSGSCLCTSSSYTLAADGKDNDCDGTIDETTATTTCIYAASSQWSTACNAVNGTFVCCHCYSSCAGTCYSGSECSMYCGSGCYLKCAIKWYY